MKVVLLQLVLLFAVNTLTAQEVSSLPAGKYETIISNNGKWDKGDIHLVNGQSYRISSTNETGEYRFSATAQRVFFTSGPLKGIFAKTVMNENMPTITLPQHENQQLGLRLAGDIVGVLRQ